MLVSIPVFVGLLKRAAVAASLAYPGAGTPFIFTPQEVNILLHDAVLDISKLEISKKDSDEHQKNI